MKPCIRLLSFLCLLLSGQARAFIATSGNDSTGALIAIDSKLQPLAKLSTVSIQSENVHVWLHAAHARVEVTYKFSNDGRKARTWMAFPSVATVDTDSPVEVLPPAPKAGTKVSGPQDLSGYTISVNGEPVPWQAYSMGVPADQDVAVPPVMGRPLYHVLQWLVSEVPLAGSGESIVRIAYQVPYERTAAGSDHMEDFSDATFVYKLSAGANWHGAIHEGRVEIECTGVPAKYVRLRMPARFKKTGNSFVWEFADLKPGVDDDIKILADPAYHYEREGHHVEAPWHGWLWATDHGWRSPVPCTAEASSELKEGDRHFAARNVVNGNESCWIEGVEGDGVGESITLSLKKPCRIDGFHIANGFCQKGGTPKEHMMLYEDNNRVSELEVKVDQSPSFKLTLPDLQKPLFVLLPQGETMAHKVKFTIAGVYPGKKYHDTCIGEIALREVLTKKPAQNQAR